jgi:hypothetical protein
MGDVMVGCEIRDRCNDFGSIVVSSYAQSKITPLNRKSLITTSIHS